MPCLVYSQGLSAVGNSPATLLGMLVDMRGLCRARRPAADRKRRHLELQEGRVAAVDAAVPSASYELLYETSSGVC